MAGVTYFEPARAAPRRIRVRRIRLVGALLVILAIAAAIGSRSPAPSSPRVTPPLDAPARSEHRAALGEAGERDPERGRPTGGW